MSSLHDTSKPQGQLKIDLRRLALPAGATLTNMAVLMAGVRAGRFNASLQFEGDAATPFEIVDGLAISNLGVLSDGVAANAQALNAAATGAAARPVQLTIDKGLQANVATDTRDLLLWLEYET